MMSEQASLKHVPFPDLLLQVTNSNLTKGTIDLKTANFHPHFDQAEATITGNPTGIAAPFGNGLRVTTADRILYKFPVSAPWPCPFLIAKCPSGVTFSFWIRRNYVKSGTQKYYARFGNVFTIYAPKNSKNNVITMRWNLKNVCFWYGYMALPSDQWNLVAWVVNETHHRMYLNGVGKATKRRVLKAPFNMPSNVKNDLHISTTNRFLRTNFSVGPIRIWAGRMSPVYMWRQFQEGLTDQSDKWSSFRNERMHLWISLDISGVQWPGIFFTSMD